MFEEDFRLISAQMFSSPIFLTLLVETTPTSDMLLLCFILWVVFTNDAPCIQ